LFKIATQGVSMWFFHVFMYHNRIDSSSLPFFFLPIPLLMVVSTGLKIWYSFLYSKYINHIHLLSFFLLPSPSHMWPPLSVTCFS
jgi:hypothetical protein